MESSYQTNSFYERLLSRWGGAYLARTQFISLIISNIAGVVGIYYIIAAANLTNDLIFKLIASTFFFASLTNLLIPIYTVLTTSTARARLDSIIKGKPIPVNKPQEEINARSWLEVQKIPSRIITAEAVSFIFIFTLPLVTFMRWVGGLGTTESLHVAIGGLIAGTSVIFHNSLFLEKFLVPVHQLLFERGMEGRNRSIGLHLQPRLLGIISFILLASLIVLGGVGFQKSINASIPGANIPQEIVQFQKQAIILSAMMLVLGLTLGRMLVQYITMPIREIIQTLERAQQGDLSAQARILSSDETSQLTLGLNQLLFQFKAAQIDLEKIVDERTAALNRKTTQLLAAAQIARDSSTAGDLNTLLSQTTELVSSRFGYYQVGIYVLDSVGEFAVLQAASSDGGKRLVARGHKIEVGRRCPVGLAAFESRTRIVADTTQDPIFIDIPEHPLARSETAIPLIVSGKLYGVIDILSTESDAFSSEEIDLLQTLADQISLAIHNTELVEESRTALVQLEASQSENIRRTWADRVAGKYHSYRYTPTSLAPSPIVSETGTIVLKDTVQLDIPISLRGQTIGKIILHHKGNSIWSEADRSLATEVANQIGLALENSRLLQDAQQRAFHEQTLSGLTSRLGRSIDADTLLQTTVRELHKIPNVTEVSVFLSPPEGPISGEKLTS